jgi:hypothetical protein
MQGMGVAEAERAARSVKMRMRFQQKHAKNRDILYKRKIFGCDDKIMSVKNRTFATPNVY